MTKAILVVGASKGIGRAVADRFNQEGYACIEAARSYEQKRIIEGDHSHQLYLDVTDVTSVQNMFSQIEESDYDLIGVVFSVGVGHFAPFENLSHKQWQESLDVNLTGAFTVLQAAYEYFRIGEHPGRIIVIGSVADHVPLRDNAAYAASKFGLRGLAAVIHEEGRPYGITVTNLSLGATYTDIWKTRPEFSQNDMLSALEVAETIFQLASLPAKVTVPSIVVTPPKGIL